MEREHAGTRWLLIAGLGLLSFGILWFGGGQFLDRHDTTLMMGIPFVIAGTVVTLLGLIVYHDG